MTSPGRCRGLLCLAACIAICVDSVTATAVKVDLDTDWKNQYDDLSKQLGNLKWFDRVASQTFHKDSLILASDKKPSDVVLRRTRALLKDLSSNISPAMHREFESELRELGERCLNPDATVGSEHDRKLFNEICQLRRYVAFANPLLDFDRILFIKNRLPLFQHCCHQYYGCATEPGGGVYSISKPFGPTPELSNLLAETRIARGRLGGQKLERGSFMSLSLSYDASTMFFAFTEGPGEGEKFRRDGENWSPEKCWHVFKASADGSDLEQLTDGPWNEFDPYPLPNGRLVFISERRGGFGRCHTMPMPIYVLHSMRMDGSDIVPLSYHETNEWHPSVNNDGMIVYTRWDYVDRGDCIAHHPWITYPDGRDPRAIHGNYPVERRARPDMELHVKAIPGSHRYVSTAAGHHRLAYGSLVVIDPRVEDDGAMSPLKRLTPEIPFPETEEGGKDRMGKVYIYGTAWPLSEYYYLAVYTPGGRESLGVYLIDAFGNRELLYRDPDLHCLHPIPMRKRKTPPQIPHATVVGLPEGAKPSDSKQETGIVTCVNVYRSLKPWPEGTRIKKLRVIQLFPRAMYHMFKPNIGVASESLARGVLGTVPVEEDGSVRFIAPARKNLYFQALDEDGLAVQSMMSATYVHPGEQLTCQGCHEPTLRAPAQQGKVILALQRPPSTLEPDVSGSYPLSFPRLVQPVLDRNCVACHEKDETKKAPDLSSVSSKRYGWSQSFLSLGKFAFGLSGKPPNRQPVRTTPGKFGARASKLFKHLKKGHHKLKLTAEEMHRITLWLDCNSNFYGAYHDLEKQAQGQRVMPPLE